MIQPLACLHGLLAKRLVVAQDAHKAWTTVDSNAHSPDVTLRCVTTDGCTDGRQVVGNLEQ